VLAFVETLSSIVRHTEVDAMLQCARLTRDWPDAAEKCPEAERQIRMAMYRRALGEISDEERNSILSLLAPCCPDLFVAAMPHHPPSDCFGW